ncbi:MAG: 3-oxoacyl-ACP synthase [Pseudomonadota bacterium]|nr:3-oxoacyl-ACP synthase [Pseudomonadota bacterium]
MALSPPPLPRSLPLELATRFGMAPAWCASIAQLNCVSVAAVLRVVDALFVTHREAELALVVSVDRLQGEGSRLRHRSGIQSDGAACLLVRRNHPWNRIGRVVISSNGDWFSGAEEAGRVARQMISLEWKYTRDVVNAACADSDLPTHRYDQFLPQNFKRQGWLELCVGLGLPERNFFDRNIGLRGHACCSDLAVNLADAGLATLRAGGSVLTALHSSVGAYAALTLRPVAERQA